VVHVLFLAPETAPYNLRFVEGLKRAGASVTGVGHAARERLSAPLARALDEYARVKSLLDGAEVARVAKDMAGRRAIDRVETIDEPAVVSAAHVRQELGVPGITVDQARLCRDKAAMKATLRAHDLPCAESTAATDRAAVMAFAERVGYPLVLKPREGFGTLDTFRANTQAELERALERLSPSPERSILVEEFIEGHEGFYDTITAGGKIVHAFVGHYYPTCLAALSDRAISPQIACTNRVAEKTYAELHATMQKVIDAFALKDTATHI
jgi:biotin carboxylase